MKIFPELLLSMLIVTSSWAKNSSEIPGTYNSTAADTLIEYTDLNSTKQVPPVHFTNKHDSLHQTAKILEILIPSLMVTYGVSSFFLMEYAK